MRDKHINIPDASIEKLEEIADAWDRTVSYVIRAAISEFIAKHGKGQS